MLKNKKISVIVLPLVLLLGRSLSSEAACLEKNNSVVSGNITGCIDWSGGNLTVNSGVNVAPSSTSFNDGYQPIFTSGNAGTLTNNGLITTNAYAISAISLYHEVNLIVNNGIVRSNRDYYGTIDSIGGRLSTLENNGRIENIANQGIAVFASNSDIGSINNKASGLITSISGNAVASLDWNARTTIDQINNAGTISVTGTRTSSDWSTNDSGSAIFNGSQINTITNTGNIFTAADGSFGIMNNVNTGPYTALVGSIGTLNNAQGVGNVHGALTYSGTLPTFYNIIINSPSSYGQLAVTAGLGSTTFGISSITGANIGVAGTLYQNVLTGVLPDLILNENTPLSYQTGTSIGDIVTTYRLVADDSNAADVWDLLIASYRVIGASTDILAGSTNSLSGVGSSLNPVFDGGVLSLVDRDNSSLDFTVQSRGATVSSPSSGSATLSGVFSGNGAMVFNGNGTTYMNGINTYTGGTTVASGTLSVGSSEASKAARIAGNVAVNSGATLAGHGGITGNVTNNGTVKPGGSIGTLSIAGNYQQNASANLTTTINPTTNSVLAIGGTASLDGSFTIDAESGTYAKKKYTILTSSGLSGQFSSVSSGNLSNYTSLGYYLSYDTNNVYLTLTPSLVDTRSSMTTNADGFHGVFNQQSAIINNGLSYDCTTFDIKGVCLSAGGRVTDTTNPSSNSQGALLIASYKANENLRIGGYLDQNVSSSNQRGVNLENNSPMAGVFAVWNQNADGTGYEARFAAGYSDKDVSINRSVVGTAEAGRGESSLQSQAYSATISRGFKLNGTQWIASPYLGIRYIKLKRAGYTEESSVDVTSPLTYSGLSQESTTALAGVRLNGRVGDQVSFIASAGVEGDIAQRTDDYAATGLDGLSPLAFNQNIRHIRPVVQAGANYAIDKRQAIGAHLFYRQEAFNSSYSATGMVNYQIGF